jgi:phosphate-selective porin OprO and OprP
MNAMKLKGYSLLVISLTAVQMLTFNAAADDTNNAIQELKKQIQALSEKVNDLEFQQIAGTLQQQQKAEADAQRASAELEKQKAAPFITAGTDGFSLESGDTNFILKLHGFAQVDSHYYASAAPGKDEFTIRRMRAIASGTVYHVYDYYLQTDFASGITSTTTNNSFLQDAYVNIHYLPEFQVQVGKMKPPVGLELLALDEYLWFLERGFPYELGPNRDVGAEVHGLLFNGALNYSAGAFNGVPDGGSGDAEVADNDKDVVARLFSLPFKNTGIVPLQKLGLGFGGSYGLQAGTTTPTFATMGRQTFFSYKSTVSEGGEHVRLDPQAYYFWGPFGVYGEYAISDEKFKTAASSANFHNSAWDVVGSYFLTGEDAGWGVLPDVRSPFRIDGSGWGALQLVGRFGEIALDPNAIVSGYASSTSAQGATSWSLGLDWYLNRNVKCILEYSDTTFDGGSKAPGAVTAQTERAILGRLQFGF